MVAALAGHQRFFFIVIINSILFKQWKMIFFVSLYFCWIEHWIFVKTIRPIVCVIEWFFVVSILCLFISALLFQICIDFIVLLIAFIHFIFNWPETIFFNGLLHQNPYDAICINSQMRVCVRRQTKKTAPQKKCRTVSILISCRRVHVHCQTFPRIEQKWRSRCVYWNTTTVTSGCIRDIFKFLLFRIIFHFQSDETNKNESWALGRLMFQRDTSFWFLRET